jgi:hypothetical protein
MIKRNLIMGSFCSMMIFCCGPADKKLPFSIKETAEGIELSENGKKVFFYQRATKRVSGKYSFNNYLHPVYNLSGEIMTEEFPPDHLNHRGIFWAWHQLYINDQSIGDGWMSEEISQEVADLKPIIKEKAAQLNARVLWKSSLWEKGKPFIEEETSIIVHKSEDNLRKIDFEITLKPLTSGVQIGGADDEKGYGGFCVRLKMPESLTFASEEGPVKAQNLQIRSGPWMDFSAIFGETGGRSGLTILCHPSVPNYPAPWILRQIGSMQNIVFPGRERINIDKPVVLRYRVIIHAGDDESLDIDRLQKEYDKLFRSKSRV